MIPRYSRDEISQVWTESAKYSLWLEVELLALRAMATLGHAPWSAYEEVSTKASFDVEKIAGIEREVKHDVIAFLTNISEGVGDSARYIHLGMTSSDLLDTAFSVQLCWATDIILSGLAGLISVLKRRAYEFKNCICIGRSHGIHAEPTTFGLKLALYYCELKRSKERIENARAGIAVGAISGAVGTYANIDPRVEELVCKWLGLGVAPITTQVIQRDRHAELFSSFAILATSLEKIAVEVRHLQRTEVREASEGFSKGQKGSSAMPHKKNPILSENVTGLARLLRSWAQASLENIPLWHERDISHSSVERVIAPDATVTLDFMLARVKTLIGNLVVYPANMKRNLDLTQGLIYSGTLLVELSKSGLARTEAYAMVQGHALDAWDLLNSKGPGADTGFRRAIERDEEIGRFLSKGDLERIFSDESYLKEVDRVFDRIFRES